MLVDRVDRRLSNDIDKIIAVDSQRQRLRFVIGEELVAKQWLLIDENE